jgi:ATP-dependent Clp protease adaptor protein ClpS
MSTLTQTSELQEVEINTNDVLPYKLVIHNDDYNTFEWVIAALVEVCKHNPMQAEQCANIIHSKGKYAVKHGSLEQLKAMKEEILNRGIDASVE